MPPSCLTLIENGRGVEIEAADVPDGSGSQASRWPTEPVLDALGWVRKPEGLCRGETCVPIGDRPDLITPDGIDLEGLGEVLGRPLAIDRDEGVASFGAEIAVHASRLAEGIAPDFTLPDLSGKEYSLSGFKGKKVLLIAYASW